MIWNCIKIIVLHEKWHAVAWYRKIVLCVLGSPFHFQNGNYALLHLAITQFPKVFGNEYPLHTQRYLATTCHIMTVFPKHDKTYPKLTWLKSWGYYFVILIVTILRYASIPWPLAVIFLGPVGSGN